MHFDVMWWEHAALVVNKHVNNPWGNVIVVLFGISKTANDVTELFLVIVALAYKNVHELCN